MSDKLWLMATHPTPDVGSASNSWPITAHVPVFEHTPLHLATGLANATAPRNKTDAIAIKK